LIAPADIEALQRGVRNVSQYYQFYAVDASRKHSGDVPIPLSLHQKPSGAALGLLDQLLINRKRDGLRNIHKQCQVIISEERSLDLIIVTCLADIDFGITRTREAALPIGTWATTRATSGGGRGSSRFIT